MKFQTNPDHRFNFDDVYFRDLTACLLDTIDGQLSWVNRFSSGDVQVRVPIFYSMVGGDSERFLLDSFNDDIVSNSRYVEVNTSMIPRGHVSLTSYSIKSDEFANPNVWLKWVRENNDEIRKVLTRVRAIPISVKYDLQIMVKSEIDSFKCQEAIMNIFWLFKYMYFEHNFMHIDALFVVPDDSNVEIAREQNASSDNMIKISTSFEVHTYYPAVRPDAYDYKTNKIKGGGQDGITSDNSIFPGLTDNLIIPKKVKWRNYTNRSNGLGDVPARYLEGTYAIEKNSGEVIAIIQNINDSTFEVCRTYKLKDSIPFVDLLRLASENEIQDFIISLNGNYPSLNVQSTNLSTTLLDLTIPIIYFNPGTGSNPIDYTTQVNATQSFWDISSYSVLNYTNPVSNLTAVDANLKFVFTDSTYIEYIGGYNIYNQQYLIQYGINKV